MRIEGSEIPEREMRFANWKAARRDIAKLRGYPAAHLESREGPGGVPYFVIACGYGKYLREDGDVK